MGAQYSNEDLFRWWVVQQQQMIMLHLGKLANPATGKIERDLNAAKLFIDLLGMLETKTKGNLDEDEERLLGAVLTNARLNYVQEANRPEGSPADEADAPAAEENAPPADGSAEKTP